MDIFAAAGLKKPDISILSDEFLAEVSRLPQRNLAVELLRKLLNDEIKTRSRRNVVKSRLFSDLLDGTIRKYQNRAVQTAQVIEELISLAKQMREESAKGAELGLSEDEVAFYDALEVNDSAVKVLGDATLKTISRELVETVRRNTTIRLDCASLRVLVKHILRKYDCTDGGEGDTHSIGTSGSIIGQLGTSFIRLYCLAICFSIRRSFLLGQEESSQSKRGLRTRPLLLSRLSAMRPPW